MEGISVWIDGGIHIKTCDPHGDPVEMSDEEALALAALQCSKSLSLLFQV